ncbi:pyridoxal-phosphate dependent enzyme [Candidatus Dependentiae bacterium]|nr:pyridoxal-phosphate dependent enzyme [Candidatus Dependentiae bacterium]
MKLPLFKQYPELEKKLPYISLGNFPTPVVRLKNLGKQLKVKSLYLKNDGISSVPFGGNKIRKLELLFADAIDKGFDTVVTIGRAGSNHSLTTIACAKKVGLKAHSFLSPQLNAHYVRRNLLLSLHYGGKINYFDNQKERNIAARAFCDDKNNSAYFIPLGASCALGVVGFVNAAFELKEQIEKGLLPEPDYIYVPVGSAGTATGLIVGLKLAGLKSKVIPVRVSGDLEHTIQEFIDLLNETSNFLCQLDVTCQQFIFSSLGVGVRDEFAGDDYALVTPRAVESIRMLYDTEGIKLDGTYTGKAFAALLDDAREKVMKKKTILFWNTFCSGDFAEIINRIDYKKLPEQLHFYFKENVQELDQGV